MYNNTFKIEQALLLDSMAYVCRSKNGVPPRFDFQHPVTLQICRHFHRAECAKEKDASKELRTKDREMFVLLGNREETKLYYGVYIIHLTLRRGREKEMNMLTWRK